MSNWETEQRFKKLKTVFSIISLCIKLTWELGESNQSSERGVDADFQRCVGVIKFKSVCKDPPPTSSQVYSLTASLDIKFNLRC